MKKYKVMVGDFVDYVDTIAEAHSAINFYIDWWFNDLGGMGTPESLIIDLTTGEEIA